MRFGGIFGLGVFSLASAVVAQDIVIPPYVSRTNPDFTGSLITTASSLQGTVVIVTTSNNEVVTLSVSGSPYTPPSTTSSSTSSSTSTSTFASTNPSTTTTPTSTPITTSTLSPTSTPTSTSTTGQDTPSTTPLDSHTVTSTITTTRREPTATSYTPSSIIDTVINGHVDITTTLQIPASVETQAVNTLFSTVQSVQRPFTTTHFVESTEFNTVVVQHSSTSVNRVAVDTRYESVLLFTTDSWTTTSQKLHTSVQYKESTITSSKTNVVTGTTRIEDVITTLTNTLTPPIPELTYTVYVTHNSAIQETTYDLPTTGYYSHLDILGSSTKTLTPTETIKTSIAITEKTTLTQEFLTTILSQPFSTQTIAPSVYYPNGSNIETIVIYESCSIVSKTSTTSETDIVTFSPTTLYPSSTYTLVEPTGTLVYEPIVIGGTTTITIGCTQQACNAFVTVETVGLPVSYETVTETEQTQFVDVTTVIQQIESVVTVSTENIISTELIPYGSSGVRSWFDTKAVETVYSENTVVYTLDDSRVETIVHTSQSIEVIPVNTVTSNVPYQTEFKEISHDAYETVSVNQSPLYATTTYVTDVPVNTLYTDIVETTTITTTIANAWIQNDFANEASSSKYVPSSSTLVLTLACIIMIPLLV